MIRDYFIAALVVFLVYGLVLVLVGVVIVGYRWLADRWHLFLVRMARQEAEDYAHAAEVTANYARWRKAQEIRRLR